MNRVALLPLIRSERYRNRLSKKPSVWLPSKKSLALWVALSTMAAIYIRYLNADAQIQLTRISTDIISLANKKQGLIAKYDQMKSTVFLGHKADALGFKRPSNKDAQFIGLDDQ